MHIQVPVYNVVFAVLIASLTYSAFLILLNLDKPNGEANAAWGFVIGIIAMLLIAALSLVLLAAAAGA